MMRQEALSPFISVPDTIGELLLAVGASVPFGQEGKVHVWGRNDMATNQKLGIGWVVKDPDGIVAEDYSDWQTFSATPGGTHEFISPGRFDLNKTGTWTISIALFMNPDAPVTVDTYEGVLCVVEEAIFAGTIIKKELEYDETRGDIPVY
ncbi:hypothetical protein ES707_00201 [subsurface metagenome]